MLQKSQRLNLKKSFSSVSAGKRVETSSMRIFMKMGESDQALVGIALTKKYFNKAVDRNRAKRLVSTAIQVLYPRLKIGLNLIIMPKDLVLKMAPDELIKELENVKDLYRTN